ncbi:MAG: response regulator [Sulfuricella sp.]
MISEHEILNASVLVVDDQPANVQLLGEVLRDAGYTSITTTTDPYAVCELYRQNRYDLILLDLQMPGMDGFQVMEGLKAIETDGYLPVLVITAQPDHKLRALAGGERFRQQTVRSARGSDAHPQHVGSAAVIQKARKFQQGPGTGGTGPDCRIARQRGTFSPPD